MKVTTTNITEYLYQIIPNLFQRQRVPHEAKVSALVLYFYGLALRKAAAIIGVSHEALRKWWARMKEEIFAEKIEGNAVVAVDEMKVNINGYCWYVWIAFEVKRKKVIYALVSKTREKDKASLVMKMVKKRVTGKLRIITDKGPWYWEASEENMGYWEHEHERFGERSLVESVIGIKRYRLRRFNISRLWYKRRDEDIVKWLFPFLLLVQFSFLS
ncbi:DDE-type integrase/transposase/recombinase [Pseudothermotoga thermarum]|uniref:DDE domain-containing protein n=3 Tax=Pseudothermotoga thermarum DSM 5069 TaxID=688269 RepID=F7YTI5_9THEM|nr:DDE-type integrase/transposase/recombinase [Pseudothermotoga thermarum]AEH51199.1 hypothetical protein Theth_1123 [Pseudothermotoga thermarum DSM 5069]AEH51442.1 hypothetical protein Theth_1380 [Pseudothermotoga thermarum DSM 5069]AEH51946.1 hypothetical protein Theth_1905 [Pseudothermotoga thermarum DSM 5069]